MSALKVQRLKVIFYGLLVSICITLLVLVASMNNSDTNVVMPLSKQYNDTQFQPKQLTNVLLNNNTFDILIFNPPQWLSIENVKKSLINECDMSNCRITNNRSNLHNQSAIIFYITAPMPWKPPILQSDRNPNQAWIFAWKEAPVRHRQVKQWSVYQNEHWRDTANWTMAYTYDADMFYGYGMIRKRIPPVKNYSAIFYRKTKMVAWIVSNCHTQSQRDKYVEKLQQYGVEVNVFGRCGQGRIDVDKVRNEIDLNYKFYLSFENCLCKDYITEKFFKYFKYDVLLVVRGGGNYSSLLPNDSYINTADFESVKDLAKHLLSVGSSEKRYIEYLMNKDRFESNTHVRYTGFCHICEKLNKLEENRRTYTDLLKIIHNGTCFSPMDIR